MKIKAHVPTQQYGFIEISGDPEERLEIERLYNEYAEHPVAFRGGNTVRLTDYFGNEIDYDAATHTYSWRGEVYESGSQYAAKFDKPFDKVTVSAQIAKRDGVNQQELLDQWELNGEVSRGFGTALHGALELFGKYGKLHDYPFIKDAVESFYAAHKEKAEYEVLIVDHKNKRAGRVDRLVVGDTLTVEDFKTNADLKPDKLAVYWKQLEFYGEIIKANGGRVSPPRIHHFNGSWTTHIKEK